MSLEEYKGHAKGDPVRQKVSRLQSYVGVRVWHGLSGVYRPVSVRKTRMQDDHADALALYTVGM
jgi:hypothetical protein